MCCHYGAKANTYRERTVDDIQPESGCQAGSVNQNVAPRPGSESTPTCPP
jgi:hypothetical protein